MLREMGSKAPKPRDPAPPPPVPKSADAYDSGASAVADAQNNSSYLGSMRPKEKKRLGGGTSFLGGQ